MLRGMAKLPTVSFVGAGSLTSGLSVRLREAGFVIDEIVVRSRRESLSRARAVAKKCGAHAASMDDATYAADVIWFAVSDDALADCAQAASTHGNWRGKIVLHSSGALTSDVLSALQKREAKVASLHPMMTFVKTEAPRLQGVAFAVEGDRAAVVLARRIAEDLGGEVFTVKKSAKPLYHAFGAFLSPLLVAQLTAAEEVARMAGVPPSMMAKSMTPIILRTLENYFAEGGAKAFSGPLLRGDVETIRRHTKALGKSGAAKVYRALARYAVAKLPVKERKALERVLR